MGCFYGLDRIASDWETWELIRDKMSPYSRNFSHWTTIGCPKCASALLIGQKKNIFQKHFFEMTYYT